MKQVTGRHRLVKTAIAADGVLWKVGKRSPLLFIIGIFVIFSAAATGGSLCRCYRYVTKVWLVFLTYIK